MNQKIQHTPEGVRDIYGEECERKRALEKRIGSVLSSYGYREIETPTIEFFDVFGSEVGTIPSRDLYKFFDREGNTLALRPDFTPSIARAWSKYFSHSQEPVRLQYLGSAFVNYQGLQGRLKESTQMGAELIGESSADGDAEVIAMAADALRSSGLKDFQISVGHAGFFESLVHEAGLDGETEEKLRALVHNHNSFGIRKLLSDKGVDRRALALLTQLPSLSGDGALEKAYDLSEGLACREAVERLMEVRDLLGIYGASEVVTFDFGMLSAYRYYTGILFRGYTYGIGEAVVKGGRYDRLLEHFGKAAPSVGFVVVVSQLICALSRQKIDLVPSQNRSLILYSLSGRTAALKKAVAWRRQGRDTETLLVEADNLKETADRIRLEGGYAAVVTVDREEDAG